MIKKAKKEENTEVGRSDVKTTFPIFYVAHSPTSIMRINQGGLALSHVGPGSPPSTPSPPHVSSLCVGRTIFAIPRIATFGGRRDTRFILAYMGNKHPAIMVASAQRTLRLLALCRGSGRVYCVLVPCAQLLARSRLVLVPCGLRWALRDVFSHPREVW